MNHLEQFLVEQRTRLRDAANELIAITDRVPGGLGDVRPPLLSAADDDTSGSTTTTTTEAFDPRDLRDSVDEHVDASGDDVDGGDDAANIGEPDTGAAPTAEPTAGAGGADDATQQLDHTPVFGVGDTEPTAPSDDEFTFSFDDDKNR